MKVIQIVFDLACQYPRIALLFIAIIVYNYLKARIKEDGSLEYKDGIVETTKSPVEIAHNFKVHHNKKGHDVDIKMRKNGFEATVTDPFGNEEHYDVRKSRKRK